MAVSENKIRKFIEQSGLCEKYSQKVDGLLREAGKALRFDAIMELIIPVIAENLTEADVPYLYKPPDEAPPDVQIRLGNAMAQAKWVLAKYTEGVCRDLIGSDPAFTMNASLVRDMRTFPSVKDIPFPTTAIRSQEAFLREVPDDGTATGKRVDPPVKDIPACRRTIESIYRKHGFIVEEWTDDLLKCRISALPELDELAASEVLGRLNAAWKEIDAVIHEVTE